MSMSIPDSDERSGVEVAKEGISTRACRVDFARGIIEDDKFGSVVFV